MQTVQTVEETRRERLKMLVKEYGTQTALQAALQTALQAEQQDDDQGKALSASVISRLLNANTRTDRPGKAYEMGSTAARKIEKALKMERGWMDTPPSYDEHPDSDIARAVRTLESMPPAQREQAVRVIMALAEKAPELP